jgi:mono/diheme cytochrome c family protein
MKVDPSSLNGPYRLEPDLASALTNIGNCLPDRALYATGKDKMAEMDGKFAAMTFKPPGKATRLEQIGLPQYLSDTDLVSFDSRELAKTGVLSYAVAYPRWIDPDAAVMRHVRVPVGQSIAFDETSQQFVIPGGSRFYKTVLQRVTNTNADGKDRWRKVETQLIVSWPNVDKTTGSAAVSALFGTYAWNDDESQATLVTDPYRNGTPFRDRIVTYVSDEAKAAATLATQPSNSVYALRNAHALRSYAIPGSRRCMQCHLGSASKSFVLGFQPLQVARRKLGEGGVIDPVGDNELDQLSRFIGYGLITGIASSDDLLPLEKSQGTRTPRNNYELIAQGYLLGNCAHCHNPMGDPSLENPSLQNILDFMPSTAGGVFKFPLDQNSPRITRAGGGTATTVPLPYITPSVMELRPEGDWTDTFWTPKCNVFPASQTSGHSTAYPILAPWRSLIYRGVDTPFTYSDDLALIPHMPLNTQSFDCRAPRIVGDWMASIPATLVNPTGSEYSVDTSDNPECTSLDTSVQPYREVKRGQLEYQAAVAEANARLAQYHDAPVAPILNYVYPTNENPNPVEPPIPSRYNFCPDNYDIFDPQVLKDPVNHAVPGDSMLLQVSQIIMPRDMVPDHAHWVVLDPTLIPGAWAPRRPDWSDVLVLNKFPPLTSLSGTAYSNALAKQNAEKLVVDALQSVTLSSALQSLARTTIPMGLWQVRSTCNFSAVGTVSSYATARTTQSSSQYPAAWMQASVDSKQLNGTEPVYAVTPGEAIHDMICSNCHGVKANSAGREATILSEMTGGRANVTDLIDGIMNPDNRQAVFSSAPSDHANVDDWAARYFTWMGLGGTQQTIPSSILAIVANTRVLNLTRPSAALAQDANMLSNALNLCSYLLPMNQDPNAYSNFAVRSQKNRFNFEGGMFESDDGAGVAQTTLIYGNGDVLLWERVCSVDNPPPVRALTPDVWSANPKFYVSYLDFYDASSYPATSPAVDQRGNVVTGISSSNYFPWCLRQPSPVNLAVADAWRSANLSANGQQLPYCPPYITPGTGFGDTAHLSFDKLHQWAERGAINAGLMVFAYLELLASGDLIPTPSYDRCEQLSL